VDYVWQVEPGTTYTCEMFHSDPFQTIQSNKKQIGFAMSSRDSKATSFSLWPATQHFMKHNPESILPSEQTIMPWLLTSKEEYNFCHMWTSFQIVSTEFLKSEGYKLYMRYLDLVGGFFYER
jgi:alpha 1,2-mannosyltransferase